MAHFVLIEQVGAWLYAVGRNRIIDEYGKPRMTSLDSLAADVGLTMRRSS